MKKLIDNSLTLMPSGSSAMINGQSIANGDYVRFNALSDSSQRGWYEASGVGSSISWSKCTRPVITVC